MRKRKLSEEERDWKNARCKIRRLELYTKNKDKNLSVVSTREKPRKMYRKGYFTIDGDTGYWNCGSMSYSCKICSALHFLGEKNTQKGSTMTSPKFSECCTSGQVTAHFFLSSSCIQCSAIFQSDEGHYRQPKAGECCSSCGAIVPKVLPNFPEPPHLLRELLTSNSAEARHFRRHIRHYNSALAMASVRAEFVARGLGVSKYNPTITVHGRMYHEMGALIPPTGKKPRFAAVYIHDTEQATQNRKHFYGVLREDLLGRLASMLHVSNNLVRTFVSLRDLIQAGCIPEDVKLVIHAHERTNPGHERKYNIPEASEVAALIVGEQYGALDIVLRRRGEVNMNGFEKLDVIRLGNRMYDPLCYPLLFPYGNDGWHSKLTHLNHKGKKQKVTPLKFYSRLLFQRECEFNVLLYSGRLFQQYLCEMFMKVECERLSFLRENQTKLRSCDYTHLCELLGDASHALNEAQVWTKKEGAANFGDIGKLVVLPSTHIGSERYMRQKMHDIIAISNSIGHPDVFLTMTCNPRWPEIQESLLPGQRAQDRPDLCNRVFRMKHKLLMVHLKEDEPFGRIVADVSVIEFQKRGLVHAHIILFLHEEAKRSLENPEQVDKVISAEIPRQDDPILRQAVIKHLIHRPCTHDSNARCLRDGKCSKRFPKAFRVETGSNEGDYYVSYRRRSHSQGGEKAKISFIAPGVGKKEIEVDNSWIVPHSPELIRKFNCHLNAELCISHVGSIKYLFKYVCKGPDRVTVEIRSHKCKNDPKGTAKQVPTIDEIQGYQDARYISASEAAWRLFSFPMVEHHPSVERLEVHLEGKQTVYFEKGNESAAAMKSKTKSTKLIAWFEANQKFKNANHIRYIEFPKYFTWNKADQSWKPRAKYKLKNSEVVGYDFSCAPHSVVGRMYNISPREGERYFLRTLLLHRSGMTSFKDMLKVDGTQYSSYREVCCAMGLLADDAEWMRCLQDAFASTFEPLTTVFATIIALCEPSNPVSLWENNTPNILTDLRRRYAKFPEAVKILEADNDALKYAMKEVEDVLKDINSRLSLEEFGFTRQEENMPALPKIRVESTKSEEEHREEVEIAVKNFNLNQKKVFNAVVGEILPGVTADDPFAPVGEGKRIKPWKSCSFFLDAPGGTGKTFTIRTIQSLLQLRDRKVISVATSAVAASLLEKGRTAHSVFKIPIPCHAESTCSISLDSELAAQIREADLIIWDEIIMCARYCIEAVDRTLREIMRTNGVLFGGKCVLLSGDCRQILPVVPKASRGMIVHMSLKSSFIFQELRVMHLTENMRLQALKEDPNADHEALQYPDYLLRIGEGRQRKDEKSYIDLPKSITVVQSSGELIDSIFPNLAVKYNDTEWLISRAILATTNSKLKNLNDEVIERFPGKHRSFLSADSVISDNPEDQKEMELKYPPELLHTIETGSSLPDHEISLKKGFVVMLLRNIRQNCGHVNGTRYVVHNMTKNLLFLRAVSGTAKGNSLVLPRMNCIPGMDDFPIPGFRRCQFPIRVCFAMTINKAQGQSVPAQLGIDLSSSCFAHGQLYVALSRATHPGNVYMRIDNENRKTKNVVYPEVLSDVTSTNNNLTPGTMNIALPVNRSSIPLPIRVPEVVDLEEDIRSCSDHEPICEKENDNRGTTIQAPEENSSFFESSYGQIPDAISCSGITVSRNDLVTVIRPREWVSDSPISAFMMMLNKERIYTFDTMFVTLLRGAVREDRIGLHADFLQRFFGRNFNDELSRLRTCNVAMIPLINCQSDGSNGTHWGLAVLHKPSSTVRLYDSVHSTGLFEDIIPHIVMLANSIKPRYKLSEQEWPTAWNHSLEVYSSQQGNGYDCGVFTMLNAFYVS